MAFNFESNAYLKCILGTPLVDEADAQTFDREQDIVDYAKKNTQFKYGNVNRHQFNKKYSPKGWEGRKVIAIPAALYSGFLKTIYHLATAIFIGIPKAVFGETRYLKAQIFCFARDLQESFGRFISIFNDKYGQFHIQESSFHKLS